MSATAVFRCATRSAVDAQAFCALSNSLYARPVDPLYYEWQFFQTPFPTLLAVLEDGAGGWKGCYGFQMRPLAGSERPAAWAIDIMIAQPHQRHGLFASLARYAAAQAQNYAPRALCVMANVKAEAAHVTKLGWQRAETLMTHFVASAPYASVAKRLDFFPIDDFAQCEPLFAKEHTPLIASDRSTAQLNWRFKQNPRYRYETTGIARDGQLFAYLVTKRFRDPLTQTEFGDIVDLMWLDDDAVALEDILRFALGRFHEQGVTRGATWLQTNTPLDSAGRRLGFARSDQARYFCVQAVDRDSATMENGDSWFLTMADAEVY